MTIAKTGNKAQASGNGVTVAFAFPYRFFAESDLGVYILSAAGVETKKTLTTHYSVSNTGTESGGTVTFLTAPASGELITIVGEIPYTQTADYTPNDAFPAETHEAALDRGVRLTQRVQEVISRAIVAPVSDTSDLELPDAATRSGKYLYFNPITGDVSAASSGSLTGPVSFLGFTNSAYTVGIGELAWNDTDKTLDLGMTSSVTQQIGQEVLHYCKNNSGVAIANGQVVRVTGASGNALTIALADATDAITSTSTVGVATEDIADNASGMVTMIGLVRGIDTSAFTEGDTLYLSETAGALTATSPVYPAQSIKVAVVVRDHATMGSIFVHVENMQSEISLIATKQPLDADLTALAGLATAGMIARTGAGTVAARTLTAGTGISISNGDGVAGNPTITNTLTVEATVLLGTLATTSGTSVTLSSLVLTDYKFLKVVFRAVSTSDAASNLQIAGDECSAPLGNAGNRFHGTAEIDLSDGTWSAAIGVNAGATGSASGTCYGGNSGYTTATTSVTFAIDVGTFDAGSILVYGVK